MQAETLTRLFRLREGLSYRIPIIFIIVVMLGLNYLMQHFDYLSFFRSGEISFMKRIENVFSDEELKKVPVANLFFAKFIRFLLNDLLSVFLLFCIFFDRRFTRITIYVLIFNLVFLFPLVSYLLILHPTYLRGIMAPLHFVIMNPVIILMLIPFFIVERYREIQDHK